MSHGDAIPAMQMQTCMIFVQIPLSGPIIISQLSPFLFPKTTMAEHRAKDGEEKVPETYQQRGMESPSFETSVTNPSGTEWSLRTPTVNDYYRPPPPQHKHRVYSPALVPHLTFSCCLSALLPGAL